MKNQETIVVQIDTFSFQKSRDIGKVTLLGINDVMIPYFTKTRTWKTWSGIIRRTDNRDPKWINEQNKEHYIGCTLDSRWYKLSAFKEWIEQSVQPQEGQTSHDDNYGYGLLKIQALLDQAE